MNWDRIGAHLLALHFVDAPLFYLSPEHLRLPGKPARGGVPVMFPQFANKGPGPKHGLVRQQTWHCISETETTASFSLELPPDPSQHWSGHALLTVGATLMPPDESSVSCFSMRYCVRNIGEQSFDFTGGLHPYFAVADVQQVRLQGLDEVPFEDRYGATVSPSLGFLKGQAFERLYFKVPCIELFDGVKCLKISAKGFDNWMVWNPGAELSLGLHDMPAQDWRRFLCVEPIVAATPVELRAGEVFQGGMEVRRF